MSNPFRARSSSNQPAPEPSGSTGQGTPPLHVNTRVPSTQKHVNFASPPAVPISPASYPSSPESTRQSPGHQFALPQLPETVGYGQVLHNDPFQEETLNDGDDRAIAEAAKNARANSEVTLPTTANQANVRDTLSRFASGGRRPQSKQVEPTKKPAMDVNAFTRLLLTGESGASNPGPSTTLQMGNDSSSSTDTASTQPSYFDATARTVEATPRSSSEQERHAEPANVSREAKRRPPPPKPRQSRGVETTEEAQETGRARSSSKTGNDRVPSDVPVRGEQFGVENTRPSSSSKKPPPPPVARRKSQKASAGRPEMPRSGSSRYSLKSESDEPPSPSPDLGTNKMTPPIPPPPSRRPISQYGRRPSADLPATHEEDENENENESDATRPLVSTGGKRVSQSSVGPPPVPPPRKNRASGRSSMDSQHRPSMSALGLGAGSARSSSEYARPGSASRNISNASNAADILADLEALQREVDAARASAGK